MPRLFWSIPIYDRLGEWIGWVTAERKVDSVLGRYVGYLIDGPRIVRRRATATLEPPLPPPPSPSRLLPPATVPLAPLMSELPYNLVDVLLEEPERLHTLESGEFPPDMD
ncbi:MAG: hypothetical protein ACK8QZ_04185 [Anaerolineales bacterium]